MTLIEVKNLNKIYGSGEAEVKALKNINLNILLHLARLQIKR